MNDRLGALILLWIYVAMSLALIGAFFLVWTVGPWWLAAASTVLIGPPLAVIIAWVMYTLIGAIRYDDILWDKYGPHRREKPWLRF